MPKSPVRGILFDKDGTLFDFQATWKRVIETVLDTLAPDRETWSRMALAGGYDPVRGRFLPGSPVVAGSTGEIAALWAGFRPDLGAARIEQVLDDAGLDALADPAALFPTAADLPGLLAGLRTGIGEAERVEQEVAHGAGLDRLALGNYLIAYMHV